jgi:hypothetical protein
MKTAPSRALATAHLLLISPSLIFMCSLLLRHFHNESFAAQHIVMWYAGRMWSLWVLLLALPLAIVVTGCLAMRKQRVSPGHEQQAARRINRDWTTQILVGTTTLSILILAVVVLHMLAN